MSNSGFITFSKCSFYQKLVHLHFKCDNLDTSSIKVLSSLRIFLFNFLNVEFKLLKNSEVVTLNFCKMKILKIFSLIRTFFSTNSPWINHFLPVQFSSFMCFLTRLRLQNIRSRSPSLHLKRWSPGHLIALDMRK